MEGGKYKVAGKRRLNTNVRGFFVSHLPYHYNVRVGPKKRAHGCGKIKTYLMVGLNLAQTYLGDLHRVFCRPYLDARLVDVSKGRMKRCRLSGACRAAHKYNAVWLSNKIQEGLIVPFGKAYLVKGQGITTGQDTQYDVFHSTGCWHSGYAKLDVLATILFELYLTVLGPAAFRNVQIRHDFEPGDNGSAVAIRDSLVKVAHAVNPEPDLRVLFAWIRFDVNI